MIRTYKRQKIADKCLFCAQGIRPDYKDVVHIRRFLTERYLVISRRYSAVCAKHQRQLSLAVKNARHLALIPYTDVHAL
jgi:small subunit ribosomal protein S18